MTMQESLLHSMRLPDDAIQRIHERGAAVADVDTMSQAIHDVYCGIMADHDHPNEKDRHQAEAMIAALQNASSTPQS